MARIHVFIRLHIRFGVSHEPWAPLARLCTTTPAIACIPPPLAAHQPHRWQTGHTPTAVGDAADGAAVTVGARSRRAAGCAVPAAGGVSWMAVTPGGGWDV